ncbi:MAG: type II secretion system minor pseudopilin GspI [Alphaproteobacteria bacterium]|nr:type II secretion system minor pseudopilin GspI [Alphaproteobacteria bacterium]
MRIRHQNAPQAGFSLLELMVAVSLLSLVVIPLLLSQGDAMRNAAKLEERALAAMVAENVLLEAITLEKAAKIKSRGTRKQGTLDFAYRVKRQNEKRADADIELVKVTVNITRRGKSKTLASLTGYQRLQK